MGYKGDFGGGARIEGDGLFCALEVVLVPLSYALFAAPIAGSFIAWTSRGRLS